MSNRESSVPRVGRDLIIDRIYDVALEPALLDDFIELWHDTDLSAHFAEGGAETPDGEGDAYRSHLERAQGIMQLGESARIDLAEYLRPYNNLAAFVVDRSLWVKATNPGAQQAFGATTGTSLHQLTLPPELRAALIGTIQEMMQIQDGTEKILKTDTATKGSAILFRVIPLADRAEDGPLALVVSTHFHWRKAIGALLGGVFQLTEAEQDIVRMLVAGQDTKSVATDRATSEGTVRAQIKSITSKMNLRSQTDIVRFTMALGEFPKGAEGEKENVILATPTVSGNWLEAEVWKPFQSLALPDGRRMTYHDMGPPNGNPAVFSHMGSCMVRWPRSMLRLAFELDLRVICPVRAGYGHSDGLIATANPIKTASEDTAFLLDSLEIQRLPYVAQGSDFPFAVDL
ncbi:bifunctional helix-turn-helix transcriptional regulator/alpha/beta hydrolase [Roseivivax sp. CAU 1753]